jgi:hypothetical protein
MGKRECIMHQINLSDRLYLDVQRRAAEAGFANVGDYVADMLQQELPQAAENLDHFFTPERLAHIDRAADQIKAGEFFTSAQVRAHFQRKREA